MKGGKTSDMRFYSRKTRILIQVLLIFTVVLTAGIGVSTGVVLAGLHNSDIRSDLREYQPAIPTQILDRDGELIAEIFSDVKRDIVPVNNLPKHLIFALLSREDASFFDHKGFSIRGTVRAAWNLIRGTYFSGGSTLTQQVSGRLYADRSKKTIERKLIELWFAFQMERELSKYEILEIYMNEMYFGHNTYGVEAASQFYFNHPAEEITVAEAAILVIQLASPSAYSPINHPERARARQQNVLEHMISLGYITAEEADISYQRYWDSYNYGRTNIASAYFDNTSKAPYFSEYVRLQLNDMLYGAVNINQDGFIVHTSLDLDIQKIAQEIMEKSYRRVNEQYNSKRKERLDIVEDSYIPIIDLLSLSFDIPDIRVSGAKAKKDSLDVYYNTINPALEMLSGMFGSNKINTVSKYSVEKERDRSSRSQVEGALVTLDNKSGHILAMVGGSEFETKRYNRAVDAKVQPGSSFKPFYYSAAISSGEYTPASRIYDGPIVFFDDQGRDYTPMNYLGSWQGSVLLRDALANSMNVPSLQILDGVGFEPAIDRAADMLDMADRKDDKDLFPRSFPLGLGVTSVAPIDMARAYTTFPNLGRPSEPLAITRVMSRQGEDILNPEQERLRKQRHEEKQEDRVMSPQAAYVMLDILQSTVDYGTLRWRRINVGGFDGMPMGGKTGTTQNWGDAWTLGFSPYYTTAVWFGFDTPGNSLGRELTGATAAGPTWAEYMKRIHKGMEIKEFDKPESGLVNMEVCIKSGLLPTQECDKTKEELFVAGTEPKQFCDVHPFEQQRDTEMTQRLQSSFEMESFDIDMSGSAFDGLSSDSLDSDYDFDDSDIDDFSSEEEDLDFDLDTDTDTDSDTDSDTDTDEDEGDGNVNPLLD
ncbi:MAG: penicillin-binding protein 1A [Spirochaetaceae bacterium]